MTTADEVSRYTAWSPPVDHPRASHRPPPIGRHRFDARAALRWRRMLYTARHARR